MATFTMNAQKSFSKSAPAKNIFDKALAFSITLIIIIGGIWAVEKVLIYSLNKQIKEYQTTTQTSLGAISGEDVQKIHDVTSRIVAIEENTGVNPNAAEILATLEKSTIPQTKLSKYEYKSDGSVTFSGKVSDYRFLAEQLLRYRQEKLFASAEVSNTTREEDGQISFDILVAPKNIDEGNSSQDPSTLAPAAL